MAAQAIALVSRSAARAVLELTNLDHISIMHGSVCILSLIQVPIYVFHSKNIPTRLYCFTAASRLLAAPLKLTRPLTITELKLWSKQCHLLCVKWFNQKTCVYWDTQDTNTCVPLFSDKLWIATSSPVFYTGSNTPTYTILVSDRQ
jgi:hypothetical protein